MRPFVLALISLLALESCRKDAGQPPPGDRSAAVGAGAPAEKPRVSRYRFGCTTADECRMPGAECGPGTVIGKCDCRTDADCTASETCYGACEVRCAAFPKGCPRGGYCGDHYAFCIDPRQEATETFDLSEWKAKAMAGVPGHQGFALHATYDEWNGSGGHLRVSFRGNGSYVIELDGIGGWNRSLVGSRRPNAKGRELLRTGMLRGTGKTPAVSSLRARSCPEHLSEFRAELVLVAEFANLYTFRGLWRHPRCEGFPKAYVDSIWAFVTKETSGAVQRFDHSMYGDRPPTDKPTTAPDPDRLPCWPGQSWSGTACTGRPTSCPPGFMPAADGCAGCPPGRVAVDGAGSQNCCWPGQTFGGACRGTPACPKGFVAAGTQSCAREPPPPPVYFPYPRDLDL